MSQHCILFYKYHPLTSSPETLEVYRVAQETLCTSLHLTGRILIGLSEDGEGINGTLAGGKDELTVYVDCMLGRDCNYDSYKSVADSFRESSRAFFQSIDKPELMFHSEADFKWSSRSTLRDSSRDEPLKDEDSWFPDLNIKLVKEIISTGGAFSNITGKMTSVGYLTPKEWHEEMKKLENNSNYKGVETVLIDVRNHKECQIGTFLPGTAIDPNTRTFSQFPKWVRDHSGSAGGGNDASTGAASGNGIASLENKRILMYCTGGIRCEKASAYVRQVVPNNKGVFHLKGGIHKYLEEFGASQDDCKFIGKNFVFDRRGAMSGTDCLDGEQKADSREKTVGQCLYCDKPHDIFLPENICTVCREPVLVCRTCVSDLKSKQLKLRGLTEGQNMRVEFHCEDHFRAKTCYYTSLHGFSVDELNEQMQQLQLHSQHFEGIGKKGKQKRRTIRKQIEKIEAYISSLNSGVSMEVETELQCRNCGCETCSGDCWGFHGGNKRMINMEKAESVAANIEKQKERTRTPSNQRSAKRLKREKELSEVANLQLCKPASEHRLANGLRVPPSSVRVIRSSIKGKWCGKTLQSVMTTEFNEFRRENGEEWLGQVIDAGLLRINGVPVTKVAANSNQRPAELLLSNMDTLERVVHWHEPPISVPDHISFTKHHIPDAILSTTTDSKANNDSSNHPSLYCINKPASVPVHPAGPYYANSLLMMVKAQESLSPKSLIPCHRIDRCTSGVLLCTNNTDVARVTQGAMTSSGSDVIKKLYVARVKGRFPGSSYKSIGERFDSCPGASSYTWHGDVLEVNAPIAVQLSSSDKSSSADEASSMMHRSVSPGGKSAVSLFKLLCYDAKTHQSLVSCCPITGRGHQLRVHLQYIGYPIHNDVEYGGELNVDSLKERESQSVQSMLDAANFPSKRDGSVTDNEAATAIKMCKCCSSGEEGVKAAFQSAHLLGGGHAIDLHAFKYSIRFMPKGNKEDESRSHEMVFDAGLPIWATEFEGITPQGIDWLK